jgi:hypothetical protein
MSAAPIAMTASPISGAFDIKRRHVALAPTVGVSMSVINRGECEAAEGDCKDQGDRPDPGKAPLLGLHRGCRM